MNKKNRQQGIITIVAAMLLAIGVIFILVQSMDLVKSRSVDTAQDLDSAAALLLAESGQQRAVASLNLAGTYTGQSCTDAAPTTTFTLGRGTFRYNTGTTGTCTVNGKTFPCCTIESIGTVGNAVRSVKGTYSIASANGVAGRGTTVSMVIRSYSDVPSVSLFALSSQRQGSLGNADVTLQSCATCTLLWNLDSSSGNNSGSSVGTLVPLKANANSEKITQVLDFPRDYVEIGAQFPGLSNPSVVTPTLVASYWSDDNNGSNNGFITGQTFANNNSTSGYVTSGVYSTDTSTCRQGTTAPLQVFNPPGSSTYNANRTFQPCYSWCTGGPGAEGGADTLVFGFGGRGTITDEITPISGGVQFNTAGTGSYPAQNVNMSRLAHFPNTDGTTANASGTVYTEVWWTYNRPYTANAATSARSTTLGAGLSSYPQNVYGYAGGQVTLSAKANKTDGTISIATPTFSLCKDDVLRNSLAGTVITSVPGGVTCSTSAGIYGITPTVQINGGVANGTLMSYASRYLIALGTTGATLTGSVAGTTATATPTGSVTPITASVVSGPALVSGTSTYTLKTPLFTSTSASATAPSAMVFVQGTPGTTVYVPTPIVLPTALSGTATSIVQVYKVGDSGSGMLQAGTNVSTVYTSSFTLSLTPSSPLVNVQLCGGTCALFNDPGSTPTSANRTQFSFTAPPNLTQWASGFMCLKNVDYTRVRVVTNDSVNKRTWWEPTSN